MKLSHKAKELHEGYQTIVSPENGDSKWLEFGRLFFRKRGREYSNASEDKEIALDIFRGHCDVEIEDLKGGKVTYEEIGERADVFSGVSTMVYVPKGVKYTIKSKSKILDVGVFVAPSRRKTIPVLIKPNEAESLTVGESNWRRKVYIHIGEKVDADRLIVGETFNSPGNWSSYPPHKHDSYSPPREAPYEEVYFFLIQPPQGFAIQRIYTSGNVRDSLDEVYIVGSGDTVVIPRGYHPVVAAPGYQLCYFWALAGEEREYGASSEDPKHNWIKTV